MEHLTEPVENRINYILNSKQDNVALRLRLMGPPIIDEQVRADVACYKADDARNKADDARNKANDAWDKADASWYKAYVARKKADDDCYKAYEPHYKRLYPDSPWDGKTIFAGEFKR
jgi:hypothetical protein